MLDFIRVTKTRVGTSKADGEIYQLGIDFNHGRREDIVVHGGNFAGFYDQDSGMWKPKTDFFAYALDILNEVAEEERIKHPSQTIIVQNPIHLDSKVAAKIDAYMKARDDDSDILFNQKIIWQNEKPSKFDFATTTMDYSLSQAGCPNYDALMGILYSPEDRTMMEWLAGAALCGDGNKVDKFVYLEGEPGSGKSTFLNILERVFGPYGASIKAEDLASSSGTFATAQLKNGPLVAIQHDGDLSKIEQNTTLNNIVSHEPVYINEKYAKGYYVRLKTVLFVASNEALRLTNSLSGLLRRCLDPMPTGKLIPRDKYDVLYAGAMAELGAIAQRMIDVYQSLGHRAYNGYRSTRVVRTGNPLGYWVERTRDCDWARDDECLLSDEYQLYRAYCEGTSIKPMSKFMFERQMHFFWSEAIEEIGDNNSKDVRYIGYSWHSNAFVKPIFPLYEAKMDEVDQPATDDWLAFLSHSDAILEDACKDMPAQYAAEAGCPRVSWDKVTTTLSNIISSELHYVKMQPNHIVIDLDGRNKDGAKDISVNIEKAKALGLPPTYAELSKSGNGIHMHYFYDGDTDRITRSIDDDVEVKVFNGNASLRRKFTLSNGLPIATISSGIPLRQQSSSIKSTDIKDARHLENIIKKGLRGEFGSHVSTIDFFEHILNDVYEKNEFQYNLLSYKQDIVNYASMSTHHAKECSNRALAFPYKSRDYVDERPIAFFDMEVFPNYNCLVWKVIGGKKITERFPSAKTLTTFFRAYRAIGYNNKDYDNAIAWCIMQGGTVSEVYQLSHKIVKERKSRFIPREAIALSYSDVLDYCSTKQRLKKWELELGIVHKECPYDFDKPLPEEAYPEVEEYCGYDVDATEAVFNATQDDWAARKIMLKMVESLYGSRLGLSENSSTNDITAAIIFGDDRHPQDQFVYTDLSDQFPGYSYEVKNGKVVSTYKGEVTSEGGLVRAILGYYERVGVADVASMHPSTIRVLNLFGPKYTKRYGDLVDARFACKHNSWDELRGNVFEKAIHDVVDSGMAPMKALGGKPLKIPINAVYGESSAKFANRFKDPRNVDNIVAKRGALFMIDLRDKMLSLGYQPIHIKTDSMKFANFTDELFDIIKDFGKLYGYSFELEEFYSVFCLVTKADYIAFNTFTNSWEFRGTKFGQKRGDKYGGYVFKTLFSHEEYESLDFAINKSSDTGVFYIGDKFCGRNINVVAVKEQYGGTMMVDSNGARSHVQKTTGYFFKEYEELVENPDWFQEIDLTYYDAMVASAKESIEKYIPFETFLERAKTLSY